MPDLVWQFKGNTRTVGSLPFRPVAPPTASRASRSRTDGDAVRDRPEASGRSASASFAWHRPGAEPAQPRCRRLNAMLAPVIPLPTITASTDSGRRPEERWVESFARGSFQYDAVGFGTGSETAIFHVQDKPTKICPSLPGIGTEYSNRVGLGAGENVTVESTERHWRALVDACVLGWRCRPAQPRQDRTIAGQGGRSTGRPQ
jgi:hypothetical protein